MESKLGRQLRSLRKQQELTQSELARRVDISREFLAKIESGLSEPSLATLKRLAAELKANLFELVPFPTKANDKLVPPAREAHWNATVKQKIDQLERILAWAGEEETYAERHHDWHTERAMGRAQSYLKLAAAELWDTTYFEGDRAWLNNWRKAQGHGNQ